ncbi:hypothetical protein ACWFR5_47285 [Streptomyces sp. NPDC055092]
MPKPCPEESREDVVRVCQMGHSTQTAMAMAEPTTVSAVRVHALAPRARGSPIPREVYVRPAKDAAYDPFSKVPVHHKDAGAESEPGSVRQDDPAT